MAEKGEYSRAVLLTDGQIKILLAELGARHRALSQAYPAPVIRASITNVEMLLAIFTKEG
jgi:hypothetical protein